MPGNIILPGSLSPFACSFVPRRPAYAPRGAGHPASGGRLVADSLLDVPDLLAFCGTAEGLGIRIRLWRKSDKGEMHVRRIGRLGRIGRTGRFDGVEWP